MIFKKNFPALMMLCKNMKEMVRSPDGDTNFFDIVTGVLKEHTLTQHLFILCLDYILRISIDLLKENGFTITKKKE